VVGQQGFFFFLYFSIIAALGEIRSRDVGSWWARFRLSREVGTLQANERGAEGATGCHFARKREKDARASWNCIPAASPPTIGPKRRFAMPRPFAPQKGDRPWRGSGRSVYTFEDKWSGWLGKIIAAPRTHEAGGQIFSWPAGLSVRPSAIAGGSPETPDPGRASKKKKTLAGPRAVA